MMNESLGTETFFTKNALNITFIHQSEIGII